MEIRSFFIKLFNKIDFWEQFSAYILKLFPKIMIALSIIIFFAILILPFTSLKMKSPVRIGDTAGYFAYLPAVFEKEDLSFNFMKDDPPYSKSEEKNDLEALGFHQMDNGKLQNKYTPGVAILLIPFYLLGLLFEWLYINLADNLKELFNLVINFEDSSSNFEQFFCFFGGLIYFEIALIFLKKILEKHFSAFATLMALLAIIFGTNLLNYATFENLFSHIYSFLFITLLIYLTPRWYENMSFKNSILLGIVAGYIVLIRVVNIVYLLWIPLYQINNFKQLIVRLKHYAKSWSKVAILLILITLLYGVQLFYTKYSTGLFLINQYQGESFNFLKPEILNVLFSVQKGLFFWSPILIFAIIGIIFMKSSLGLKYSSLLIIILTTYIISSWWNWEFGWSFGHRAFVDGFAIFTIGLANFVEIIGKKFRRFFVALFFLMIFLSTFQTLQYWLRILPAYGCTWEDYKTAFLSLNTDLKYFWRD